MKGQAAEAAAQGVPSRAEEPAGIDVQAALGDSYSVASTGASLSMEEAKARLLVYCSRLPGDKCAL